MGPDFTLGALFDFLRGTNKQDLRLRDVLTHQADLKVFIPFWQSYVNADGSPNRRFLRPESSVVFPLPVVAGMWSGREVLSHIYHGIAASPLAAQPTYVYSDLSFIRYPYYVQKATGRAFDQFLTEYTACQFCPTNRRALGFDKPDPKNPARNSARSASPRSYGHPGFTGTYFWVEPGLDLFVILLTNRVNPTRRNNKLGVRAALLQLAIESALPGLRLSRGVGQ